jgi:predicted transcriptional regulator
VTYRDRLDIIADILSVARATAKRTQIMYQANLSYKVLCKYLDEVIAASLLSFDNGQQRYVLTTNGKVWLAAYFEYSRSNKSVEKRLDEIRTKKKVLEDLCGSKQYTQKVYPKRMLGILK